MKIQSPSHGRSPSQMIRYSFQIFVEQIKINIKFPCKLTVSCSYKEGVVRGTKIVPLMNNVAGINQNFSFTSDVKGEERENEKEKDQGRDNNRAVLEVSIITDSGTSLAGTVTLNLRDVIQRNTKELFQLQRCPDKAATIKMKIKSRCLNIERKPNIVSPTKLDPLDKLDRGSSSQSQVTLHRESRFDFTKTGDLMKQEVSTWKTRVVEYQNRYRNQRIQNNKLNQLIKSKEQIYLSLKAEIKRKEIQIQTVLRTLEQYKQEYSRLKTQCQKTQKERNRLQTMGENIDRLTQDRMSKLQTQSSQNLRKIQRLLRQNQKLRKQKQSTSLNSKTNIDFKTKQLIQDLNRQNQHLSHQLKSQKESYQKQLRECQVSISDKEELYVQLTKKYQIIYKKFQKLEQNRVQELHRINSKMLQIEKSKETMNTEIHVLKKQRSRKDLGAQGQVKTIQRQLTEQSTANLKLTQTITQLQEEKIRLQKSSQHHKAQMKLVQDQKNKYFNQVDHLKYQITNLNQLIFTKNNQLKQFNNLSKEYEEVFRKKQQSLQEEYTQHKNTFQVQLQDLRKSEESKYIALTQVLIKKQKDIQGINIKQERLQMKIENLQTQINNIQNKHRQKQQLHKSNEQKLKQQKLETMNSKNQLQKQLRQHIHHLQFQIQSLNDSILGFRDNQFRFLQRQEQNRVELEQLKQMYSSVNIHVLELKQEIQESNQKVQHSKRDQNHMSGEIRENESKYRKQESQHREKIVQLEGERARLTNLLKEKERSNNQTINFYKEEMAGLKKEIQRRELEYKKQYDQYREMLHKQRAKFDELQMQKDKLNNQLTRVTSLAERNRIFIQQLQQDAKNYKQTIKQMNMDKESFQQLGTENQELKRLIQTSKTKELHFSATKEREIKNLGLRIQEISMNNKEMQLASNRISIVMDEIHGIICRMGGGVKPDMINDQYQKMMQIRKGLFCIQSKIIKQSQKVTDYTKLQQQNQSLKTLSQRHSNEKQQLKSRQSQLRRTQQTLKKDIELLNKTNAQLLKQVLVLQNTSLSHQQKHFQNSSILLNQIQSLKQQKQNYRNQSRCVIQRYQKILQQNRSQSLLKQQKIKMEFMTLNRNYQLKVQELQHKVFRLEIDRERLTEIPKKDQEIKRLNSRIFQIEREHVRATQEMLMREVEKKQVVKEDDSVSIRVQKQVGVLKSENQRLGNRIKEISNQLKEKQNELQKAKLSNQALKSQYNYQKSIIEQEKASLIDNQSKLKIQIDKQKSQIAILKRINQQTKTKLIQLQSSTINNYSIQILNQKNIQLSKSNSKLHEEVFSLTQKIQQLQWELQQTIIKKDNEMMVMQEEMYSINSAQNMQILKQSEYVERVKALQKEKRQLQFLVQQGRNQILSQNESIRQLQFIVNDQQQNINVAVENQKKYQNILKSLKFSSN